MRAINMQVKRLVFLVILVGVLVWSLLSSLTVHAATFTVTNTNDSGGGSLRQAIIDANNTAGIDTITFSIGSGHQQIIPTSPMPAITRPVIIDGTTQAGFSGSPLIELSGNGAGSNAIGLRVTGNGAGSTIKGLVINRFSSNGIFLDSSNNTVVGNYVGTTADGGSAAGNGGDGIGVFSGTASASANGNLIGGTTATDRNVISGNGGNGIGVTAQDGGSAINNTISGNYIGTNAGGTVGIANQGDGVLINNAEGSGTLTGNTVGGTTGTTPGGACTGACNLLSGNTANGLGLWHGGVTGSSVAGNYVGTNVAGTAPLANGNIGVEVNEAPNNTVGGLTPSARNILSGNNGAGLFLTGAGATGDVVLGNYIGTNSAGTAAVPNQKMGIGIGASPNAVGAHSDMIGGTTGTTPGGACTGACNLISGNIQNGIYIEGSESYGHQFLGNYIGTDASGSGSIGNHSDGIGVVSVPNLTIGDGTNAGRNVISGNGANGIIIVLGASTGNRIQGNYIGESTSGSILGNTSRGVVISDATDTAILGNSIAFNGGLGIDLDNNGTVNQNDPGDGDGGANRSQNFPNIYGVHNISGNTKISGQFNSAPSGSYRLQFFSSDGCNAGVPSNYGEGQTFLGSIDLVTDVYGNTAFTFTPSSPVGGAKYITSTATKKIGNTASETSEFSQCVLVNVSKPALTDGATWYLKYDLTTGPADKTFGYGFPAQWFMCAWDPDQLGVKLPVVYYQGTWFMRASYTTGKADRTFSYGSASDVPVCGDWNGDGIETVGVVTPGMIWNLRDSNDAGPANYSFHFGGSGARPIVGDWDGNGTDTVGVVDSSNTWNLRNALADGTPDANFHYGIGLPIVGDWDGNGQDTVGVISSSGTWALRNFNADGNAEVNFQYGFPGTRPLVW